MVRWYSSHGFPSDQYHVDSYTMSCWKRKRGRRVPCTMSTLSLRLSAVQDFQPSKCVCVCVCVCVYIIDINRSGLSLYPVAYVVANAVCGRNEARRSTGHTVVTTCYSNKHRSKSRQLLAKSNHRRTSEICWRQDGVCLWVRTTASNVYHRVLPVFSEI